MKQEDPIDWQELATVLSAPHCAVGPIYNPNSITVQHGAWAVTVDRFFYTTGQGVGVPGGMPQYGAKFRIRAPFTSVDRYTFWAERRGLLGRLLRWLGADSFNSGDALFDEKVRIVTSSSVDRSDALLAADNTDCDSIRKLLQTVVSTLAVPIEIRRPFGWRDHDVFSAHARELHLSTPDTLTHDQITSVVVLFRRLLDRLHAIGSAGERNPRINEVAR